jgi:cation transport ATPase
MNKTNVSYWVSLGLVTAVMAAAMAIVFGYVIPEQYPAILPFFLALVVLVTGAGQVLLARALQRDPKKFNSWYLIYKSVKMLIIMTFMLIYVLAHRKNGLAFLASVFVIYLVYMVFESRALNQVVRRESAN